MKILVVNCGSSSVKYKLYEFPQSQLIDKGLIEKIGEEGSPMQTHHQAMEEVFSRLLSHKAITSVEEITAVGHRIVHGGETFRKPRIITGKVLLQIKHCSKFAPLHNPANLEGIKGCRKLLRDTPQIAVFDTAFHHTIPDYAYHYAISTRYYRKYGIRKYGFHGTSHQFVAEQAAQILKKPLSKLKLITCHLGNGCSIAAVNKGQSIDTSMGFTPLEGLMMGTRCGDIDTAAILYLMEKEDMTVDEANVLLNRKSGLLGVSGVSNDMRVIKKRAEEGNSLAQLAVKMFLYRIKKYIGSYYFVLGGADAICFTAGIGENNPDFVSEMTKDVRKISRRKTKVLVIPTDEELMIGKLAYSLTKDLSKIEVLQ